MRNDKLDDDALWLDAGLDDELDAARSLALQQRLASDPAFRAAHEARRALRDAVRADATRHAAPDALRARLAQALQGAGASTAGARRPAPAWRGWPVWTWLSGAAVGAVVASFATWVAVDVATLRPQRAIEVAQADAASEAVSAHTRSMLVGQPIEVASSDQHTVRPWLSARLNFVPPIVDLAPQGFALIGARRDVISGEIAAALVYRHGAHFVSVFIQPLPAGAGGPDAGATLRVVRGFNVVEMTHAAMAWRLVSDMNAGEMQQFAELLRKST